MAFNDIDICNLALSELGAARIESFQDNTIESKECNAVYNMIVRRVQAKGPWCCNKLRITLPQVSVPPTFGFSFAYQLPVSPECLRVLRINENLAGEINFQIENNLLLCDQSVASIIYIGLITDPTKFGPYLEESIVDHLVAQMSYKFTGQVNVAQAAKKYAAQNLESNLTLDNLQGSNDNLPSDLFVDVRLSNGQTDLSDDANW